jgi:hypothetical protein
MERQTSGQEIIGAGTPELAANAAESCDRRATVVPFLLKN